MTYAGRVDKAERNAAYHYGVLYHVARSALNVAHESLVVVQQGVEYCGFSSVGLPHYCHRKSVLNHVASGIRFRQTLDHAMYFVGKRQQLFAVGKCDVFLAKVELKLYQ